MSVIKHKKTQLSKIIRTQIILIVDFILNKMYPLVRNQTSRLFNDPNARLILTIAIVLVVAFAIGIGSDHGG